MKKILLISTALGILLASCQKDDDAIGSLASNDPMALKNEKSSLTAAKDYLVSTAAGTGNFDEENVDGPIATAKTGTINQIIAEPDGKIYYNGSGGIRLFDGVSLKTIVPPNILGGARSFAKDKDGNFYTVNFNTPAIYKITPGGSKSIFAGCETIFGHKDGKALQARFAHLESIVIGDDGSIYVSEIETTSNTQTPDNALVASYIRKITPTGTVTTMAGGLAGNVDGQGTEARFNYPLELVKGPQGHIYIRTESKLRKMTPQGLVSTVFNHSGGQSITVAQDGSVYGTVIGEFFEGVYKTPNDGNFVIIAGQSEGYVDGTGDVAKFDDPTGIAYSVFDNSLYIGDNVNHRLRKIKLPN